MKRLSVYRNTKARNTCLAEYVHRLGDRSIPKETQRQLLKAHHGEWQAISVDDLFQELDVLIAADSE